MSYTVFLRPAAEHNRRRLQEDIRKRITRRLLGLEQDPRPPGVEKLRSRQNSWRIRIGEYRVLYEIEEATNRVIVFRIDHRRDVYRR